MDEQKELQRQHVTENATEIHPNKGDGKGNRLPEKKRRKFQRFKLNNTGEFNGKWRNREVTRRKDNLRIFRVVASQCDLPHSTEVRAEKLFVDIPTEFRQGFDIESLAFSTCLYALNEVTYRWDPVNNPKRDCFLRDVASDLEVEPANTYRRLVELWGEP